MALNISKNQDLKYDTNIIFHDSEIVRYEILRKFSKQKKKQNLKILYQYLTDTSPLIRGESVKIIGDYGFSESINYLWDLLKDREQYVRIEAAKALVKLTKIEMNFPHYETKEIREKFIKTWIIKWKNKKGE